MRASHYTSHDTESWNFEYSLADVDDDLDEYSKEQCGTPSKRLAPLAALARQARKRTTWLKSITHRPKDGNSGNVGSDAQSHEETCNETTATESVNEARTVAKKHGVNRWFKSIIFRSENDCAKKSVSGGQVMASNYVIDQEVETRDPTLVDPTRRPRNARELYPPEHFGLTHLSISRSSSSQFLYDRASDIQISYTISEDTFGSVVVGC